MSSMIVTATFIGKDGSLGYKNGATYRLQIIGNTIMRGDDTGKCPYGSIAAFLKNWTGVMIGDPFRRPIEQSTKEV